MTNKLRELFAAPRGKLIPAGKYSGKVFYTSPELKESYLLAIQKSSKASPVYKKIFELIQRGIIIPVYKQKSFLKSIFKQNPIELEGMGGMALPDRNIIYIFVEQNSNLFSFVSNNALATVTLHELIHLFSYRKPKVFLNLFKPELVQFYKSYFCRIFTCNEATISNKDIENLILFIYSSFETSNFLTSANSKFSAYYSRLKEIFQEKSMLSDQQFEKMVTDYIVMIKLIQKFEKFGHGHEIIKIAMVYKHLISPIYTVYKNVFKVDALKENEFTYQELFVPSEIISLLTLSAIKTQKIYQAINKL